MYNPDRSDFPETYHNYFEDKSFSNSIRLNKKKLERESYGSATQSKYVQSGKEIDEKDSMSIYLALAFR